MDPNSETETEPECEVCDADRIAHMQKGQAAVPCPKGCKDSARSEPVKPLKQVADISGAKGALEIEGVKTFRACARRAQAYEAQAAARKCAGAQCYQERAVEKDGYHLCHLRAADRSVSWRRPPSSPRERAPSAAPRRRGSPAPKAAQEARWLIHVRDPLASPDMGWGVYHGLEGHC